MATLVKAPDLYTKPPKNADAGARWDYREFDLTAAQMVSTNIFAISVLPAGHRLMDFFLESEYIDTMASATITVGILNTYYDEVEAAATHTADYDSGGVTDVGTSPALVSGHNLITAATVGQAGGRPVKTTTLNFSYDIGVDKSKDRIIAFQFVADPGTAAAGLIGVGICIDQD